MREARPSDLQGDTLTLAFPATAQFQLTLARDPKNATLLSDALYDVTGHRLEVAFELGEETAAAPASPVEEKPATEQEFIAELTETFDARERET